ncbi:MAG: hypothetical protein LH471_09960 [Salinibacterium sp.]|nr:hypothetical protein [Salinibacterium sp.]
MREMPAPPSQGGRRAASQPSGTPGASEPLSYATIGAVPSQFAPPVEPAATVYAENQASDFRTRDFSPQSRRSLREAAQAPGTSQQGPVPELPLFTQALPGAATVTPPPAPTFRPAPVVDAGPIVDAGPVEYTLTRRELRALQNAEQVPSSEALWPEPFAPAMPRDAGRVAPPMAPPLGPAVPPAPSEPASEQPTKPAPEPVHPAPAAWTPPIGHWTSQLDAVDDRFTDIESTINRTVGGTRASTSALVLPEIPLGSDIRGALTHTGEVMLTGSIDLPMSLSSTGTTARIDQAGIDDLFDWRDEDLVSLDSQPVRAVTAVSTRIGGHGVTHTQKPKGTRGLTALLVTACVLAVVVTGLIIAAFALNIL